jgi:dihydrofolate reductase
MHVFLIAAISVDGQIGQAADQVSTAWTSKEDKKFFTQRTKEAGLMVLGSQTFRTFGRFLPGRKMIIMTRDVEVFRQSVEFEVIEVDDGAVSIDREDVLYVTSLSPRDLVAVLERSGNKELAVCGGSSIYAQFMEAGLIETLYLTIEPIAFGKGVPLFGAPLRAELVLKSVEQLSEQTLLCTYVRKSQSE